MKSKRREFVVSLDLPDRVTTTDMALYIREAIQLHLGLMPAEEPMAALDVRSVQVKTIPNPREVAARK